MFMKNSGSLCANNVQSDLEDGLYLPGASFADSQKNF